MDRYLNKKDDQQAITICDDFIKEIAELEKKKTSALYLKITHLMRLKKSNEALEGVNLLIRILTHSPTPPDPKSLSSYFYLKGQILESLEQHEEAIQEYSKSLSIDDKFYKSSYARAACYNKVGKFDEAIDDYESGILSDSKVRQSQLSATPRQALATLFNYSINKSRISDSNPLSPQYTSLARNHSQPSNLLLES